MTISGFFFGRKQKASNGRLSSCGKLRCGTVRMRTLSMEPLETRDLLSVTTGLIDASAYSALRAQYPDFNLPEEQSDLNVMVVDLDEGATELKLEDLKTAITEAGTTTQPDLILVKTSASANSVLYTSNADEITIEIDSTLYGSVTIIGWGEENFTLDANQKSRVMRIANSTTVVNLGDLFITYGYTTSSSGGGIYNSGTLTVTNCMISRNTVYGESVVGGGIFNNGTLQVTNSKISGNTSNTYTYYGGSGGGIYNNGTLKVNNSEISGNTASGGNPDGGGICNFRTLTVTNCTISGNLLKSSSNCDGGGISNYSSGSLTIINSIVSGNQNGNVSGNLSSNSSNNLIGGYNPGFICPPLFDSNGGLANADTMNLHLRSDSIAIDKGDNTVITDFETDIDGNARIIGENVDIGAYEYQGDRVDEPIPYSTVVNTLKDSFDLTDNEWSLREAIYYAPEFVTITFADNLEGKIVLTQGQLDISAPLSIDGDNRITIDADQKSRVFYVSAGTQESPVVFNGLTIQNGKTNIDGGGICNYSGTLIVTNCTIARNSATHSGGGISNYSGITTVTNCIISRNNARGNGGGIWNCNSGILTVTNSEISGNISSGGNNGGGVANYGDSILTLTNCTISNNTTTSGHGGGISNDNNSILKVNNCTIARNSTNYNYNGGGIWNYSSNLNLYNTIVVCNTVNEEVNDIYTSFFRLITADNNLSSYTEWNNENNNIVYDPNEPLFMDAANGDYSLAIGSQAIDKGNNQYAVDADGSPLTVDLANVPRIQGESVDIGAYEFDMRQRLSVPEFTLLVDGATVMVTISEVENASSYTVLYQTNGSDGWRTINNIQGTTATFDGALGTSYNVRVQANGNENYSDSNYSSIQTIKTEDVVAAHNDFVKTTLNSSVVIDYRANDDATDWSVVTVQFGEASHGEYVVNEDGTISYTPESGFFGTDLISYVLVSPSGKLAPGAIAVSVGLPIATSVQKTSSSHSPSSAMAPSVDSLTDWENCCIELWAQGVSELNSGEATITLEYNPVVYAAPVLSDCADGAALSVSQSVTLPNGNVQVELTVETSQAIASQTGNLYLGTVILTPSSEEGSGVEDGSSVPVCVLDGVELTTSVETMPYDMNHNGAVDVDDFVDFATVFGTNLATLSPDKPIYAQAVKADFNKDGIVDVDDFIKFATNFGATKTSSAKPISQASAAADLGNREWGVGNREDIDSQVETPVAQSATSNSQLATCNSHLEAEPSMALREAYSAALLDLFDNFDYADLSCASDVLAELRMDLPITSSADEDSPKAANDAVISAALDEDFGKLTIDNF